MKTFREFINEVIKLKGFRDISNEGFFSDIHNSTSSHQTSGYRRLNGASFHLSHSGKRTVRLHDIYSEHSGEGSKALKHITNIADNHGITIKANAKSYKKDGPSNVKLKSWYGKHGFSVIDGDSKEGYQIERKPKILKLGNNSRRVDIDK